MKRPLLFAFLAGIFLLHGCLDKSGEEKTPPTPDPTDPALETGLPVVYFTTTEGRRFSQTVTDKTNWKDVVINVDANGVSGFENYRGNAGLRGRGNATWTYSKKPFNMKMEVKDPILGMPKHKRWCFLANWRDRSLLRNEIAFHIAQIANNLEWTPHGQFAEVFFNGTHLGNYYIVEHIRVDKNRVNVDEMTTADIAQPALSGGYLLECDFHDPEEGEPAFTSATYGLKFNIKSPEADKDSGVFPTQQLDYITTYVNNVEKALDQKRYSDLYDSIDRASFVDFWIVAAVTGNTEFSPYPNNSPGSTYLYKKRNGKLYAGPVWDFDFTSFATTEKRFSGKLTVPTDTWWFKRLTEDPNFRAAVLTRFLALEPQLRQVAATWIDSRAAYISKSEAIDSPMWPITIGGNGDETKSFAQAVAGIKAVYSARLDNVKAFLQSDMVTWPAD